MVPIPLWPRLGPGRDHLFGPIVECPWVMTGAAVDQGAS